MCPKKSDEGEVSWSPDFDLAWSPYFNLTKLQDDSGIDLSQLVAEAAPYISIASINDEGIAHIEFSDELYVLEDLSILENTSRIDGITVPNLSIEILQLDY